MKQSRYFILITSLLVCFNLNGQSVQEIVAFANEQFEEENFSIASKEYNRAFFFGYEEKDFLSLQIAHCYVQLKEFELASDYYNKAFRYATDDSLKNEALLGNSFCLLLQEKYILCLSELLNISENPNTEQKIQVHFLKGIAYFGLEDDSVSYREFNQALLLSGMDDITQKQLQQEFENVFRYHKRYRPQRAYVMSGILPGSGQFYSGSVKDGINSMVLIGGLYLIAVQVVKYYSFWDAAIALFPWVQRYYLGGMEKSKALNIKKLEAKRYESYEKIIDLTLPNTYE